MLCATWGRWTRPVRQRKGETDDGGHQTLTINHPGNEKTTSVDWFYFNLEKEKWAKNWLEFEIETFTALCSFNDFFARSGQMSSLTWWVAISSGMWNHALNTLRQKKQNRELSSVRALTSSKCFPSWFFELTANRCRYESHWTWKISLSYDIRALWDSHFFFL